MSTWNEFKESAKTTANKAIKKTSELADTASIHVKIKLSNARLSAAYEKLGKLTYKQLKTEESQTEAISEVIVTIDSIRADVKTLKIKLEEMKEAKKAETEEE